MQYSLTQIYNAIPTDTLTFTFSLNTTSKNAIGNNLYIGMRAGFVDGTSPSLNPSAYPTIFGESNNTAETWKNVTFSPARMLMSYNSSAIDVLWSSAWPYTATLTYTLAPGVTIYNASLSIAVSNQVALTAYTSTFNWTAAATPALDSKPRNSIFFNLTTSASPLNSGVLTYTFFVPPTGTNNLPIMNPATISQTVQIAAQTATLNFAYLDANGNSATDSSVATLNPLTVHHILGGMAIVNGQDKSPSGNTANDVYYEQATFYLAPVTPPDMNVTMTINPNLRIDYTRNATLTVPGTVFGSTSTVTLSVNLTRLFIDTSTLGTNGITTVKFAINKFLQTFSNYTTDVTGPTATPILTVPVVPYPYNVAYLNGGDTLTARLQILDQSIVYGDYITSATLAFGPVSLAITHMDGIAVTGTPVLIQDSLVTYRLQYTAYPNWKTMSISIYTPFPLQASGSLALNTGFTVSSSNLPPNNMLALGPNNAAPAPSLSASSDKFTLNFGNLQASDYTTTLAELYFTLQVGRTILYYDRSPVTTAWVATDNSIVRSSGVPSLVGTPKLALNSDVFYAFSSTSAATLAPCTYCFPTAPTITDCSTYTYANPSAARTAALALGATMGASYAPLNQPSVFPASLSNLQAGDRFTVVSWIQNFGSASTWNFTLKGIAPTGLSSPANALVCAYNLDGTAFTYTGTLFSANGIFFPRASATVPVMSPTTSTANTDTLMVAHDMVVADNAAIGSSIQYTDYLTTYNGETLTAPFRGGTTVQLALPSVGSFTATSSMPIPLDTSVSGHPYQVQVGQTVTATLTVSIPGGSYPGFVLSVAGSGAAVASVSASSVTSLGTLTGSSLSVGDPATVSSSGGTSNVATFTFGSPTAGRAIPFSQVVVSVTYIVPDNAANSQGALFSLSASITTTGNVQSNLQTLSFEVVEPAVTLSGYSMTLNSGDANDLVTISGTVNLGSSAKGDVYGLTFATTYATNTFTYQIGSFALGTSTYPTTTVSQTTLGFTNRLTGSVPAKAASFTFSFRVRVATLVTTSTSFSPVFTLSWSSATSSGRSGSTTAQATFTVNSPTIALTLTSTDITETTGTNLAIGEIATYTTVLTLPEGQTPIQQVYEALTRVSSVNQLVLVDSFVQSIGSSLSSVPWGVGTAATYTSGTNIAAWTASSATIVNAPDDVSNANDQISFRFRAYAPAAPTAIANNLALVTKSQADLAAGVTSPTATHTLTVREPGITLNCQVVNTVCTRKGGIQGGCQMTSTVILNFGSTLAAGYNGVLTVTVPSLNPINLLSDSVSGGGGTAFRLTSFTTGFSYSIPVISSSAYNFTFTTTVSDDAMPGTTLYYNASLTYQSVPNGALARSYAPTASTTFTTYVPTPIFALDSTGMALPVSVKANEPPGEYNIFNLTVPVSRGTDYVSVNVSIPKGFYFDSTVTSYQGASVVSVGSGIDTSRGSNYAPGTVATFADSDGDGVNDSAQFNFGILSATGANVDLSTSVVIFITARMSGSSTAVVNGVTFTPTAIVYYVRKTDLTTNPTAVKTLTTQLVTVEPLTMAPTTSTPATVDGADTITQTITLKPSASILANYYAIDLTIQLSGSPVYVNLIPSSLSLSASTASLATYTLTSSSSTSIKIRIPVLPFTSSAYITVSFQALVLNNVTPGMSLPWTYTLQWASTSYTRTDSNVARLYSPATTNMAWTVTTYPPADSLVVFGTNVDAPASNPAYTSEPIGATITYVQRVQLIEGITALTVTVDVSTVAQMLMRAVAARVTLSSPITSTVNVASNPWTISDTNADGIPDRIVLNLGTVTNVPDNDATNDYILVYFDSMLLDNSSSTQASSVSVKTTMLTSGFTTINTTNIIVIEPVLTTALVTNTSTGNAGDVIPINLTLSHTAASKAHAYNVSLIIDNLPSDLLFDTTRITVSVPYSSYTLTGSQLVVNFDKFSLGSSAILVQLFAVVQQSAYPGEAMTIGSYSTFRSTPVVTTYRTTTSARTTMGFTMLLIPPVSTSTFVVTPLTPGPVALKSNIGERYTLNATVALIKATFDSVSIVLTYANTLFAVESATVTYVPSTVSASGLSIGAVPTSSNSSSLTWTFPNVVNLLGHADLGMDVIVVTARVRLLNTAGAVRGTSLPFAASLRSTGVIKPISTTYAIVEGANGITSANDNSLGQGGSRVTTTVTVTPTALSNGVVYNLTALITTPAGFDIDASSISMLSSHAITTTTVTSNQVIQLFFTSYSYTSGNLIFKFSANVQPTVIPSQTYTTNYNLAYSSVIDSTSARTYSNTTTSSYTILTTPSTYTSALTNTGTQYTHPSSIVGPVTIGEQYYFTGSVALLSATYSSITIQLTMPTVSSQVRMAITNLSLTGVPTGVSIPLSTAPVYTTASAPRGNVNSVATWTFTGITVPSASNAIYTIGFAGALQVVYTTPTPADQPGAFTINALYRTAVDQTLTMTANQVYTTPASSLTGWSGANKEAGSTATLVYTLSRPTNMGWNNVELHIALPTQIAIGNAGPSTNVAATSIDTSTPTHIVAYFSTWAWSANTPLTLTLPIVVTQDAHPGASLVVTAWARGETAPGSSHSIVTQIAANVSNTATVITLAPLSPSITITSAQYQSIHGSLPTTVNVGEFVNFNARVPLIHGNYSTYTATIYSSTSNSANFDNALLKIVSLSVSSVGAGISTSAGPLPIGTVATSTTTNTAGATVSSTFVFNNIFNAPDGVYNDADYIYFTGTALVRNIPASAVGAAIYTSIYYQPEAITPLVSAVSATNYTVQDFTIDTNDGIVFHNTSRVQFGDIFTTTVVIPRFGDAGFGSNLTITVAHDSGLKFVQPDPKITSSSLTLSSYTLVDQRTLQIVFNLVPINTASGVVNITTLTFQSTADISITPAATYKTTVSYQAYTVPVGTSTENRLNSGTFPSTASISSYNIPILSSQPSYVFTTSEYAQYHPIKKTANVGEGSTFVATIAFLRGTTPTSSITVQSDMFAGAYYATLDTLSVSYLGPSISSSGLSVGQSPSYLISDGLDAVRAVFNFSNVINTATGADTGLEYIAVTGRLRSRNLAAVQNGTLITGRSVVVSNTVTNSSYSDTVTILEGHVSATLSPYASLAQAGDTINVDLYLSPYLTSSYVTNATINVSLVSDMAFGDLSAVTSSTSMRSPVLLDSRTLQLSVDYVPQVGIVVINFNVVYLSTVHPGQNMPIVANAVYYSSGVPSANNATRTYPSTSSTQVVAAYNGPQANFLSQPSFAFGARSLIHTSPRVINIGETIAFSGRVALIKATFSTVVIQVAMPRTSSNYLMSIESLSITSFGPTITGTGLTVGATAATNATTVTGDVATAVFTFTNVVNLPTSVDAGNDVISFSGVARVLSVDTTINNTLLAPVATYAPEGYSVALSDNVTVVEGFLSQSVTSTPSSVQGGDSMYTTIVIAPTSISSATVYSVTVTIVGDEPILISSPLDLNTSVPYASVTNINGTSIAIVYTQILSNAPAITISLRSVVQSSQNPGLSYIQRVSTVYYSSPSMVQPRARVLENFVGVDIFKRVVGLSRPAFTLNSTEFNHAVSATVDIGESATFDASVGLVFATFPDIWVNVSMPLNGASAPRMSVEAAWVNFVGPFVTSGNGIALGTNATSKTVSNDGYTSFISFHFTNVVHEGVNHVDNGTNVITVRLIARVLNIPDNSVSNPLMSLSALLAPTGTSDQLSTSLRIVEPLLTMSVDTAPAVAEGGNQMISSFSVPHVSSSNGAAYNVTLLLAYPTQIHVTQPLIISSSTSDYTSTVIDYHTLSIFFPRFDYIAAPLVFAITSTMNETVRPDMTYGTAYTLTWQSSTNVLQSRSGTTSASSSIQTFNSPQGLSQSNFSFTAREFNHGDDTSSINIGESVTFQAWVALMHATFDEIDVSVIMPLATDGSNTPLLAIETISVSYIGASISGPDVAIGTLPVSQVSEGSYVYQSNFVFHTVVNKPTPVDLGDDYIVITGTARVLNVPANFNASLLSANATIAYTGYSTLMQSQELMISEGLLAMSGFNSESPLQAGDEFKVVSLFDHRQTSTTSVYNITVTVTHPPELSFKDPLDLDVSSITTYTVVASSAQSITLLMPNMSNGVGAIDMLFGSIINTIAHPNAEYTSDIFLEYYSSTNVAQARKRNLTYAVDMTTYQFPQFLTQADFSFGTTEYIHNDADTINIGESVPFTGVIALISGTFDSATMTVFMPLDGDGKAAMAIESIAVSKIGPSVSSPDLVLGGSPSSTTMDGDYMTSATFTFTNVVNTPDGDDIGEDGIFISGVARVLDVPYNVRGLALNAYATIAPEGYTLNVVDTLNIVEGSMTVSESSTPAITDGDETFATTLTFSPAAQSNGIVYNFTTTVNTPPELIADISQLKTTSVYPFASVTSVSATQMVFRIPEYNYADGPFNISFVTPITTAVHPAFSYISNISMTYNSSVNSYQSRMSSFSTSNSIEILTDSPTAAVLTLVSRSISDHATDNEVQIGEDITYRYNVSLLSYTLASFNATLQVPLTGQMKVLSASVIHISDISSGISVGQTASIVDSSDDTVVDTANFIYSNVVSTSEDAYVVFEMVARVTNSSLNVNSSVLTTSAYFTGENLSEQYASLDHEVVEPVLNATFVSLGADVQKLDVGQSTPMTLTIAQDPTSAGHAYLLSVQVTAPTALTFDTSSFSFAAPYASLTFATKQAHSFTFTVPVMELTDAPIVVQYTVKLTNATSVPGDLYKISANLQYSSYPTALQGRYYNGLLGTSLNEPSAIAATYTLENGFPFFNVSYSSDNRFNDSVIVVGENFFLNTVIRMPSSVTGMNVVFSVNISSMTYTSVDVVNVGYFVQLGGLPTITYDSDSTRSTATMTFSNTVTDSRTPDIQSGVFDLISSEIKIHVPDALMNQDGSVLTVSAVLNFEGGPESRSWSRSFVLHQPTLMITANAPAKPTTLTSPAFDKGLSTVTAPSVTGFDAGDLITGTVDMQHFPGSAVRAENTSVYIILSDDLAFSTLSLTVRGQTFDLSIQANWNLLTDGSVSFPPTSDVKDLQLFIGNLQVGQVATLTYAFKALSSLQPGTTIPVNFRLTWSSVVSWELGRTATRAASWTLATSMPYLPATSSYGAIATTYRGLGDETLVSFPGAGKNLTVIGDINIFRTVVFLPEGTYNNLKITVKFDSHMTAQLQNMELPGGSFVTVPLSGSTLPSNMTAYFDQSTATANTITVAPATALTLSGSPDGHFVPLIFHFASGLSDTNVTQGAALTKPSFNFAWDHGNFSIDGDKRLQVAQAVFVTNFTTLSPVITPSAIFFMVFSIAPDTISNAPAYQVSVIFDLGNTGMLTFFHNFTAHIGVFDPSTAKRELLDSTASAALTRDFVTLDPFNITYNFIGNSQLQVDIPAYNETSPPLYFTLSIFAAPNITAGLNVFPSANMSAYSQPNGSPGASIAPRQKTAISAPTVVKVNQPPQIPAGTNLTYVIYEHTNLTLNVYDIYVTDSTFDNSTLFVITPPTDGEITVNTTDASMFYKPNPWFYATDGFSIRICDVFQECTQADITVIVLPVVDTPWIFAVNATTTPITGVKSCTYPQCEGVWFYPIAQSFSPDDVDLDPSSFKLLAQPQHGSVVVDVVNVTINNTAPSAPTAAPTSSNASRYASPLRREMVSVKRAGITDTVIISMYRAQNTTVRMLYTTSYESAYETIDTIPFEVCDVRGMCNTSTINVTIPGNQIRSADMRLKPSQAAPQKCWPSYLYFGLAFAFGLRGPQSVNLMEHMVDYEQFIAYSRYMSGDGAMPPQEYLNFTDCYQWTMINLPDWFNFTGTHDVSNPIINSKTIAHGFYGNHILWVGIIFFVAMAFAYLILVPIALFLWNKMFYDYQISRTGLHWKKRQRLLYGMGTMIRYAIMVYLPVTFWMLYVERISPSAHIVVIIFTVALPTFLFIMWYFRGSKMNKSNIWNAFMYEAFNDFAEEKGYWIVVILARSILISLFVAFIPQKLVSVWIVFIIKLAYVVLVLILRPYTSRFSQVLDIANNASAALACILFYAVTSGRISSLGLIITHYLVMSLLVIIELISIIYHVFKWWKSDEEPEKKRKRREEELADASSASSEENSDFEGNTTDEDTDDSDNTTDEETEEEDDSDTES